jgi:hypothetical protein
MTRARAVHSGKSFARLAAIAAVLAATFLLAACNLEEYAAGIEQRNIYGEVLPKRVAAPASIPRRGPIPESEITDKTYESTGHLDHIAFHPNGGSVIFDFCGDGARCYLLSYDLVSKQMSTVFRRQGISAQQPQYSPDGKWIVFTAFVNSEKANSTQHIGIADKNGTDFRILTDRGGDFYSSPNFSSNGKFVIYAEKGFSSISDIYRVSVETGKVERIVHMESDHRPEPAFFGSAEEIVFIVRGNGNGTENMPCRGSNFDPIRNPLNLRLCKLNLVTGTSMTLYNEYPVSQIYSSHGQRQILFKSGAIEKITPDDRVQFIVHDGLRSAPVREWVRTPGPNLKKDRFPLYSSISPARDRMAYTDYWPSTKQRIQNFDTTGPRFSVRDVKTGKVEEFLVPIPDEEFAVYRDYVKPKLDKKSVN